MAGKWILLLVALLAALASALPIGQFVSVPGSPAEITESELQEVHDLGLEVAYPAPRPESPGSWFFGSWFFMPSTGVIREFITPSCMNKVGPYPPKYKHWKTHYACHNFHADTVSFTFEVPNPFNTTYVYSEPDCKGEWWDIGNKTSCLPIEGEFNGNFTRAVSIMFDL